jgi:hypothetical protein
MICTGCATTADVSSAVAVWTVREREHALAGHRDLCTGPACTCQCIVRAVRVVEEG